ncbi:hypothetical protein POSPLADRAFT_1157257 [Postia placenta MAD-698-R-SB12]|uniref:Uncharacterized protein n=1 Tax=Postia placenta MAD-698-R-SB12 TaxID=670580 RepID=A0A1X6MLQ0_9APHY|nr:hypothetical protein POSPLADRAFT_1157257 [Postia placenta MAD-698-R-SB12]OSX57300.1 hypothetical protein POSPLADRAFT_1157257 [Postia placenta MAD-698-R-SB12]
MADRGYLYILSYLHHPTAALTLSTVQSAVAHYLANIHQSPTSLTASVISSPLFRRLSHDKLDVLCTAFRHAVQLKVKLLHDEKRGLFARSVHYMTGEWVKDVLEGFRGGHSSLKLACCGGLLLGLEDVEHELHARDGRMRRSVEEEVVLALAEVIDTYSYVRYPADWAKDFKSESEDGEEPLSLSLLLSSRGAHEKQILHDLLMSTIESAFQGGDYLLSATVSLSKGKEAAVMFRVRGWRAMSQAISRLRFLARSVEAGWIVGPFASLTSTNQDDIAHEERELLTQLWAILKTQLFTTLMLSQTILSTVVFTAPPHDATSSTSYSPYLLTEGVLCTLSHLAFVIQQFGGVATTTQNGFPELKRAFYMALDVLSASTVESARFVSELCQEINKHDIQLEAFLHAKKAYVLACIEQLIPVLSDAQVRSDVFPLCQPLFSNHVHRETYESAHSVMLAIFASYAQKTGEISPEPRRMPGKDTLTAFAEESVPFYTQCLIENSGEGRLSTTQLCLAYAALVRSASAFGRVKATHPESHTDGDVFAWYCIQALLDAIREIGHPTPIVDEQDEHLQRLGLTLIATVPSVSLTLLPRMLEECERIITSSRSWAKTASNFDQSPRIHLAKALFREISENVGDAEKEYCIQWWHDHRDTLTASVLSEEMETHIPVTSRL